MHKIGSISGLFSQTAQKLPHFSLECAKGAANAATLEGRA